MNQPASDNELERTYRIKCDAFRGFITGRSRQGFQFLIVLQQPCFVVIQFNASGKLISYHVKNMQTVPASRTDIKAIEDAFAHKTDAELCRFVQSSGFEDDIISVQQFYLNDCDIGIVEFPRGFSEILATPSDYSHEEVEIARAEMDRWKQKSLCELWLNSDTNLWITSTGDIESS